MSLLQRFFAWILPASLFAAMESESKKWTLICKTCGYKKSVWDLGGIRYKASSIGKRLYRTCPVCQERRWFKYEKLLK